MPASPVVIAAASGRDARGTSKTRPYDGVRKDGKEAAVIGISGQGPVEFKLVDPSKPPVREL